MDQEKVYEALAAHLDRLPAGFPKTETGVEIRILKRLFTPEEAELAQLVTLKPETAVEIAARTGRDVAELASRLEVMSGKGLIFRLELGENLRYMAINFIVGIWEFNLNRLDPELIKDVGEYIARYLGQSHNLKTPQLRTIPVSKAISAEQAVMPYEEARRIIQEQERIVVAPCICRKEHKMMGKGCDKPMESCIVFGFGAQYYEKNGLGRRIDQAEALKILQEAEDQGLVLQPSNTQRVVNICMCCGCCCQILINLKRYPIPAMYAASNYFAASDSALCSGCGTCMERCQMEAIEMDGDTAAIKRTRCIGCGLCVPTCPTGAMSLETKPESERSVPPADRMEAFKRILEDRKQRLKSEG